jgi:hypothetical protein
MHLAHSQTFYDCSQMIAKESPGPSAGLTLESLQQVLVFLHQMSMMWAPLDHALLGPTDTYIIIQVCVCVCVCVCGYGHLKVIKTCSDRHDLSGFPENRQNPLRCHMVLGQDTAQVIPTDPLVLLSIIRILENI